VSTKPLDPGKWAEKQAKDWLEAESNRVLTFAWHRYPDAKAARGALAAQPADFLVANNATYHLEVKETKEVNRLPKAKVRQYGMLLKFSLAGIKPYVVVYRSERKDWLYFSAAELFCFDACPPSFDMTHRPTFATCGDLLKEIFS
jgi:hypothetical protein